MSAAPSGPDAQGNLFEVEATRTLLDALLTDSRLYHNSADYKGLLDFVVRLRNFAPFNAMLLQVQKPGLTYAASAADWRIRFGRKPKEGARPLLILWPFAPVALVYDVMDTEGKDLPQDVASFFARGPIRDIEIGRFRELTGNRNILWADLDAGDAKAGSIRCTKRAANDKESNTYRIFINKHHPAPVQFVTLTHELAHLFLGHLGADNALGVRDRSDLAHRQEELEAESVAFIVCERNGVEFEIENLPGKFCESEHDRRKPRHLPGHARRRADRDAAGHWRKDQFQGCRVAADDRAGEPTRLRGAHRGAEGGVGQRLPDRARHRRLPAVQVGLSSSISKFNHMPRHSGSRPEGPRARNPDVYWIPGSPLRGQVYAGCVNLPASAPRNDKFRHQSSWPRRARP